MPDSYWTQLQQRRLSRRRILSITSAAALGGAGLALIGCGGKDESQAGTGKTAKFDPNGTLRVAIPADRGNLDPQEVGGVSNYYNGGAHFGTLFVAHPDTNEVAPHLASYEWADNNTALVIKLRDGVVSHDGEAYDAEVLKWSLERVGQRGEYANRTDWTSGRKQFIDPLGEFRILDRLTLRAELLRRDVSVPGNTTVVNMVPRRYIKQVGDKEFSAKPVGFGPYRFVSRIPDTEVRSTRNDSYFQDNTAQYGPWKPWHKDLIHFIRPEPLSMVAGLEAREFDYIPDMDVELAKQFDGKKGYTVVWTSTGLGHGIQWNTHVKTDPKTGGPNPFLDKRVRIAANLAIDRDAYIKSLLTGKEPYSYGLSSRSFGFPRGEIEQLTWKYDPAKAKALMKEAGYESGFDVDFYLGTGYYPKSEQVILAVAQDLAKIGIRTKVVTMPFADLLPVMRKHEAPGLFYFGASPTLDPNSNAVPFWTDDGFYNQALLPELGLQKLVDEESAEFDTEKRKAILKRAWIAHYEGAGWLFLHETVQASVFTDRVVWEPDGGPNRLASVPSVWEFKVLPS